MNSKERFYSAMKYEGYDRPPARHYGTPEINQALMEHLKVSNYEELALRLGDDFRSVGAKYIGPELRKFEDGSWEGIWGERYENYNFGNGTYPEACYLPFKDVEDVEELENLRFPSADWYDYSEIEAHCDHYKDYVVCIGDAGSPDFMNGIARCRGVEQVLFDIALEDPVYLALVEKRFDFFYDLYKRTLEAGKGKIDVVCFGEDLGSQNGLIISPQAYEKLFAKKMKAYFELAHSYGAKTMMHSCGSCRKMIGRLIELGLDILEVVQVDAANMDIKELHKEFYKKIAFCGSMSVQNTLPFGTIEDVVREVELRKELFNDGGMIIAPTHDIQVGTPLENIIAMYNAIGCYKTEISEVIK